MKKVRKYFEAFGDLEEEISFLRRFIFLLSVLILASLMLCFYLSRKPPVVIRVDQVRGAQAIEDLRRNNEPTSFEILGFSKRFVMRYTAYNSYTVSRDLSEAFNEMTSKLQKETRKKLIDSGLISKLTEAKISTELEFKEERIERDSKDVSLVSMVGHRMISKYQDEAFREEHLFRADLVLKKVPRTKETPEGLLVDEYREMILNQLTERKS